MPSARRIKTYSKNNQYTLKEVLSCSLFFRLNIWQRRRSIWSRRFLNMSEGEIESFESFEKFDFLAFDWYDVHSERTEDYKMLAYVSRENLIIFTEGAAGDTKKIMDGLAAENPELRSEQMLYRFFVRLLNGDMDCLSRLENEIDEYENVYLFRVSQARMFLKSCPPGGASC